jgi:hypothetical protein
MFYVKIELPLPIRSLTNLISSDFYSMPRIYMSFRRQLLAALLSPIFLLLAAAPASADQLEQHDSLVEKYIAEQHADPLVADCAAHAVFVVSTSSFYDHADFADNALDDQHATVQPWNDAFDNSKQRIKVDTIVTVDGLGFRKTGHDEQDPLKFKCGFFENKLLAFSYNDPIPPAVAAGSHGKRHGKGGKNSHGAHGAKSSKGSKTPSTSPSKSTVHGAGTAAKATTAKKTPPSTVKSN